MVLPISLAPVIREDAPRRESDTGVYLAACTVVYFRTIVKQSQSNLLAVFLWSPLMACPLR